MTVQGAIEDGTIDLLKLKLTNDREAGHLGRFKIADMMPAPGMATRCPLLNKQIGHGVT